MTEQERNDLIEERNAIDKKMKEADFINPKDMRRVEQIRSLLLSDGASDNIRISAKKTRESNRVTSFTRDRR
jgi:hypothetical protein